MLLQLRSLLVISLLAGCGSLLSSSAPAAKPATTGLTLTQGSQPCSSHVDDATAQPAELAYLGLTYLFEPRNKAPTHGITFQNGAYAIATLNKKAFIPARLPSNLPPLQFIALSDLQRLVDQDAVTLSHGVKHLSLSITHAVGSSIATVAVGSDVQLPSDSQLILMCCCTTILHYERTCAGWVSVKRPFSMCS